MKLPFLALRTRAQLKKNKSVRVSLSFTEARHVGVIYTVEDKKKHEEIKEFIHQLERDGKKVKVLCFLPENKDNYEFLFDFFTLKDISFWGNITAPNVVKFYTESFDYLYYLDTVPNPIIENILARSKAKCRIGKHFENSQSYFELMINSVSGQKNLHDGMYKYSKQLK